MNWKTRSARLSRIAGALTLFCLTGGTSQAALVTVFGTDVSFTYDDGTLFGTATVVGNSIFFQPPGFSAQSANGAGAVLTSETLIIDVQTTTPGYNLTMLAMVEQGDYIQSGAGASVGASGRLGVVSTTTLCGLIACNDANLFNAGPFADTGGATVAWQDGTSVDLGTTIGWGSDTSVQVSFQNDLTANSLSQGELAYIQKKFGAIGLVVNPVPLPAAVWLFGSGLLGLAGIARRRIRD